MLYTVYNFIVFRVYPVVENLEKSWNSIFSRPGKVMEIDYRFWKIHKKSWKLKGILSRNSVVSYFHPAFNTGICLCSRISNFGVFHIFHYHILFQSTLNHTGMACLIFPPGPGTCLFHATKHVGP